MSFFKLSKEERAEWRSLPATKAAIAVLREWSKQHGDKALIDLRGGDAGEATAHAGAEEAIRIATDRLEND